MKYLFILLLLFSIPAFCRSKPFPGFTAHLIGMPAETKAFTNQIPHGESAVRSMVETKSGNVFCGTRVTRGKTPWIFYFNVNHHVVRNEHLWPLDKVIQGEKCITAMVRGKDNCIYGATSNLTNLNYKDQADIKALGYKGGHLFCFHPDIEDLKIKDLGIPFQGEGIAALVSDERRGIIYGITVPSQIFFSFNIIARKAFKLGKLKNVEIWRNRYIGKSTQAMVVDETGNVCGSTAEGKIFKYSHKTHTLDILDFDLPTEGEGGHYDCISALIRTKDNRYFGGTFLDGKLFEFFPQSGRVKALGITGRTGHLRGLAELDGILYGFSGSEKVGSRFFAYNLKTGEYKCFPDFMAYFPRDPDRFKWVPYHIREVVAVKSGVLVAGEDFSNGRIFTYEPQEMDWAVK
jgi:hypothetical protein